MNPPKKSFYHSARDHHSRVAAYTSIVASRCGLSRREIWLVTVGALLHDIGKIAVPGTILRKRGMLTGSEWIEAQKHTVYGARMLRGNSDVLCMSRLVALCHHERWDGSGYPQGLRGSTIPLYSQVVSVADVFDALTSARSYKRPFDMDRAVRIIISGRGSIFAPRVVDGFIQGLEAVTEALAMSRWQAIGG